MTIAVRLLLTVGILASPTAADWPQMRGPALDGRSPAAGVFGGDVGLEILWRRPLGMGYSHVAVADGRAVTMFSDGESDLVAAFDAATGKELWRVALGPTYRGHDGSTDGPLGTPTLDGDRLYAVGPRGRLVALAADSGKVLWSADLVADLGARAPFFGFAATPVRLGPHLVVQTGGTDGAVTALDPLTGEVRWSAGDDRMDYASPLVMEVGGAPQLLAIGATAVTALQPSDGTVAWRFQHSEKPPYDPTFPQAVPAGEDRLLLQHEREAVLYRLAVHEGTITLEELWRTDGFQGTTAVPVFHDGHFYGFDGLFLTCVDGASGEVVWKSRPPGGRGVIYVDGQLVILGSRGVLTVAQATPAGYRQTAALPVLEAGGYTAPSYAAGRIFVRNLTELAAVRVGKTSPAAPAVAASAVPREDDFPDFLRALAAAEDASAAVEAFLDAQESFPVIEGNRVHFLYHGAARDVVLLGQMLEDTAVPEPLRRLPGTDLFHHALRLTPGTWSYSFQVDDQPPGPDPLNPRRAIGGWVPSSELVMPPFEDPAHVRPVEAAARQGRLEEIEIESAAMGRELTLRLYLPAGSEARNAYPLVVLPNGDEWLAADLRHSLDRLMGSEVRPARVAFVPYGDWVGGSFAGRAVRLVADELLPKLEEVYAVGDVLLWTVEEKANLAVELVVRHPGRFARIASQSPFTRRAALPRLASAETAWFVSWSRNETRSAEQGTDDRREAQGFRDWLSGQEVELVVGEELASPPGYRSWRRQVPAILAFLLGAAETP